MTKWYEERRPVIIHSSKPPGVWVILKCLNSPEKQIGFWNSGLLDHTDDICPRCGGKHFK